MAAQMRLTQQEDGLAVIRELLTAKPQDIIAAHEEARKQMALTDAEQVKADEARSFIAQYDKMLADIASKTDDMNSAANQHAQDVDAFNTQVEQCNSTVQSEKESLAQREKILAQSIAEFDAKEKASSDKEKALESSILERSNQLDTRESDNIRYEKANDIEASRLAALRADIVAKAARLQEIASS